MKQTGMHERLHKGFRVWLFETGIRVQQTDFTTKDEGLPMASELQELLDVLDRKFLWETQFFFPALALEAPFSVSLLEEEKKDAECLVRSLDKLLLLYCQPGTAGHRSKLAIAIQESYSKLVSFLMVYMNHQDALFREASGNQGNASQGWEELAGWFGSDSRLTEKWMLMMLRSMSFQEISQWLHTQDSTDQLIRGSLAEKLDPQMVNRLRKNGVLQAAKLKVAA